MKKIELTGGVGSGKSCVLAFLKKEYGAAVLMADEIGHEQMEPGSSGYEEIRKEFGEEILFSDGTIDRKKLGAIVFQNPEQLKKLNSIVHPAVYREILRRVGEEERKGTRLLVLETALPLEPQYQALLDETWYVYTDREVRIARLMEGRGYTRERSEFIMKNQRPDEEFKAAADVVIDNSRSWEETVHAIREHCQREQW